MFRITNFQSYICVLEHDFSSVSFYMYKFMSIDMKCFPLLKGIWRVEVEQIILPSLTKTQI